MSLGTAQPHIAAYMLLKKDGKIAFVLRSGTTWMNGYYGLPAGKVEEDESYTAAAIREAKEEVGVVIKPMDMKPVLTMHRKEPEDEQYRFWVDQCFVATKWEGEIINAEPNMHSEVAWLDPKNLPDNVIPSVKLILETVEKGEHYCEYGWDN